MWVIFSSQTGQEYDRFEDHREARLTLRNLNGHPDALETYEMRWED